MTVFAHTQASVELFPVDIAHLPFGFVGFSTVVCSESGLEQLSQEHVHIFWQGRQLSSYLSYVKLHIFIQYIFFVCV